MFSGSAGCRVNANLRNTMSYHSWNSNWPYFADVEEAAHFIGQYCRKWGRISVTQTKEKFGTARVYTHFGISGLHDLLYPGYHYYQLPKWTYILDALAGKCIRPFDSIIASYQQFIYRRAYTKAIEKYPHITTEILGGADWHEYLTLPGVYKYLNAPKLCSRHSIVGRKARHTHCYLNEEQCTECATIYQRYRAFRKKSLGK